MRSLFFPIMSAFFLVLTVSFGIDLYIDEHVRPFVINTVVHPEFCGYITETRKLSLYNYIGAMLSIIPLVGILSYVLIRPIRRIQRDIQTRIKDITGKDIAVGGSEINKLEESFQILFELNKKYTSSIRENERRVTNLIDTIDVGIVEIDGNSHIVINVNQYGADILGRTKEDIIGKRYCYELVCSHADASTCSLLGADNYASVHKECTIRNHETGERIQVIKNAVRIPVNTHSNIIESFIDITERKIREEELAIAKVKADAADEGKTNLLRKVCHDIGNRMSESIGIASIILKIPNLPEDVYTKLNAIIDSLGVMDNSLQLMRDRTMLMTGQSKLRLESIDLKEFIRVHVNSVISGMEAKGIQFYLDVSNYLTERRKFFILTDAAKLDAIIGNLIGNAKKFTKEGSVTWKIEIISETETEVNIRFSVIDTGIGIAPHEQSKVFEVYEQANEQIQKEYGGSGQGLAIVRSYIQMMGGDIWVESELGKGTSFTFELTFQRPEYVPKIIHDTLTVEDMRSLSILAADDSPLMRTVLEDKFGELNLKCVVVSSGEEVLALMADRFFDFVFLDIQMEGISGVETASKIRKEYNTPIIALTANYSELDQEDYLAHGIDDCIGKPYESKKIQDSIVRYRDKQVIDVETVHVQYKPELYKSIVNAFKVEFVNNYDAMLSMMTAPDGDAFETELTPDDIKEFEKRAHTLKGAGATVYSDNIRHIAYLLEKKAKSKNLHRESDRSQCRFLLKQLKDAYEHFLRHLIEYKLID